MSESRDNYECAENELCIDVAGDTTPAEGAYAKGRFDNYLKNLEQTCGLDSGLALHYPFWNVKEFFDQSFTILNFESSSLSEDLWQNAHQNREEKSSYPDGSTFRHFHFGASQYGTQSLHPERSGVEAVSLANNHARDFGSVGLQTTMQALSFAGLTYFGAGENIEAAFSPKIETYKGKKIALIGLSTVVGPDEPDAPMHTNVIKTEGAQVAAYSHSAGGIEKHKAFLDLAIEKAKSQESDIIIVYYHWGTEKETFPKDYQMELGRYAADRGANLVVGAHQHVIQGVEEYHPKNNSQVVPIAYGLGNFMFGGNQNPEDNRSIIFRLKYKIDDKNNLVPNGYVIIPVIYTEDKDANKKAKDAASCFAQAGRFSPKIASGAAAKNILDLVAQRSARIPQQPLDRDQNPIISPAEIQEMIRQLDEMREDFK